MELLQESAGRSGAPVAVRLKRHRAVEHSASVSRLLWFGQCRTQLILEIVQFVNGHRAVDVPVSAEQAPPAYKMPMGCASSVASARLATFSEASCSACPITTSMTMTRHSQATTRPTVNHGAALATVLAGFETTCGRLRRETPVKARSAEGKRPQGTRKSTIGRVVTRCPHGRISINWRSREPLTFGVRDTLGVDGR